MRFVLVFLLITVNISRYSFCIEDTLGVNDYCETSLGEVGVCLGVEDCPGADGYNLEICNYDGVDLIVCCEQAKHGEGVENPHIPLPLPITSKSTANQNTSSDCQTDYGKRGLCLSIEQCPSAQQSLRRGSRPTICRFDGSIPIVCCEQGNELAPPQAQLGKYAQISRKRCGTNEPDSKTSFGGIGGVDAARYEFPHMAVLGYGKDDDMHWLCGGSLISEKFVMTAAHCINSLYGNVRRVVLGAYQLSANESTQSFDVRNIFAHPAYAFGENYNDIALIELDREAKIELGVGLACLQTKKEIRHPPLVTAIGWGATELHGPPSDILQKVYLSFVSYDNCSKYYQPQRLLPNGLDDDSHICADGGGKRTDTCQGDSGGPLQTIRGLIVTVVGITSFGIKCAIVPAVYTRVSNYIPWIESIVWPN